MLEIHKYLKPQKFYVINQEFFLKNGVGQQQDLEKTTITKGYLVRMLERVNIKT